MKESIGRSWKETTQLIPWGIAALFLIVFTGLLVVDRGAQFYIGSAFLILLGLIYNFNKQINDLRKEIEHKDAIFRALDQFELVKAIKKVDDNNSDKNDEES